MVKITQTRQPISNVELDNLFEETLRPLQSKNARHIFMILRDSTEEYITTYDMQHTLDQQENLLTKKELNNWLTTLQESMLVEKSPDRGKPTTRPYEKRYTFDLWKLSEKGRETTVKLENFYHSVLPKEKNIEKLVQVQVQPTLENTSKSQLADLQKLVTNILLLKTLKSAGWVDVTTVSEETGITVEKLLKFIGTEAAATETSLYVTEQGSIGLVDKLLGMLGLSSRQNVSVKLSDEGIAMASRILA